MLPLIMLSTIGINFPSVSPSEGCRLIHSPEMWASGAGLMLAVSPFKLKDIRGPFCYGRQCMVQFDALNRSFTLIGKHTHESQLKIALVNNEPHTTIKAKVVPLEQGFRLVLYVDGQGEELLEQFESTIKTGLWACVESTTEDPAMQAYRKKIIGELY